MSSATEGQNIPMTPERRVLVLAHTGRESAVDWPGLRAHGTARARGLVARHHPPGGHPPDSLDAG